MHEDKEAEEGEATHSSHTTSEGKKLSSNPDPPDSKGHSLHHNTVLQQLTLIWESLVLFVGIQLWYHIKTDPCLVERLRVSIITSPMSALSIPTLPSIALSSA